MADRLERTTLTTHYPARSVCSADEHAHWRCPVRITDQDCPFRTLTLQETQDIRKGLTSIARL
jgi:hypothetical protein